VTRKAWEKAIQNIAGIDLSALQGRVLSGFSVEERLQWAANRKTTSAEDQAYSLVRI